MSVSPTLARNPISLDSVPQGFCGEESLLLPAGPEVHALDYDQLQRYSITAQLLNRLLVDVPPPVRVLEVGANVLNLLPRFLDPSRVQITRCDVERFSEDPDFIVIERDQPLPFEDESFDAVAALEVLEHILPEGRRFFVSECLRVGRCGLVLTCPNGVAEVEEAEHLAAEAYESRHGRPHPALSDHRQFGLPREDEVRSLLSEWGFPYYVFDNAPLGAWLPMMILSENGSTNC